MLYICIFSNKFDLNQATRVSHNALLLGLLLAAPSTSRQSPESFNLSTSTTWPKISSKKCLTPPVSDKQKVRERNP